MPGSLGIIFIVHSYFHFLCTCCIRVLFIYLFIYDIVIFKLNNFQTDLFDP